MAKARTIYACQGCGFQSPRWLGRCPDCGAWNSLVEEVVSSKPAPSAARGARDTVAQLLQAVDSAPLERLSSGMSELDRVLGGGLVPGAVVLLGGDPGIGKSTLVLQALAAWGGDRPALYVSGEESPQQVKMRAARLGLAQAQVAVLAETNTEAVLQQIESMSPQVVAVDSIQTMWSEELPSAPGSVGQVRESAARFAELAKRTHLPIVLVGHVTKEGAIAGPRVLEHMVDTVLYFEGERGHAFRILRAVKNRFGSTNEIGVFEMKDTGLQPVGNPSALFLAERPVAVPGSAVVACMEGTRPLLVEIQALVSPSTFANPRRATVGLDPNRASLLLAVLEKKMGLHLLGQDVFINVVGGVRVDEPAADLGIIAAVASSFLDRPIDPSVLLVGEVGLAGEVRGVHQVAQRIQEGLQFGFRHFVVPTSNRTELVIPESAECTGVANLAELWDVLFPHRS
jgi:DNA repair protein RadA/Sms